MKKLKEKNLNWKWLVNPSDILSSDKLINFKA